MVSQPEIRKILRIHNQPVLFVILRPMSTTTQLKLVPAANFEQRQTLILRAWEAVSTERELQGVLEAITKVLVPVVPYDGTAVISFDGVNHDCYAAHVVGWPRREGESLEEYFDRPEFARPVDVPARPLRHYDLEDWGRMDQAAAYTCDDLLEQDSWFEHEFQLAASGIRAYSSVPMI